MANDTLEIIAREIGLLKAKDELDYANTKRLEILIKMQRLILNTPTEIIQIEDQVYTDKEVLRTIKKKTPKKKVTKKVTKKKASNGKTKKRATRAKTSS